MKKTGTQGIYKRGNRYVLRIWDAEARKYAVTRTYATKGEAEAAQVKFKSQAMDGRPVLASTLRFEDVWARYLDHVDVEIRRGQKSANTRIAYGKHYKNHLEKKLGKKKVKDIDRPTVQRHANELQKTLKPSSVRAVIAALSSALDFAYSEGFVSYNAAKDIKLPKLAGTQKARHSLTSEECRRLIEATEEGDRLLVELLLRTGLRAGEASGLMWPNVDLERGEAHIRQQRLSNGEMAPPKSQRGVRTLPLPPDLVAQLKRAKDQASSFYVFSQADGSPLPHGYIYRAVRAAGKRAGLDGLHPHALRHTYGSHAARRFPLTKVAALLGDHLETVVETYAHDVNEVEDVELVRQAAAEMF